ncbi:potassium channel family protein [Leeuwenhoekiella polynyae]|uniref:Trk system potassium uptake protein TrkA n=1 Tax=Leeuwenhoekiella polynyae TaxID=1550906 RepID=A0A4Q0P227_9FLAO|nr:TrkA family potassium uptake protein [Leeuwenhoekiella polynyae]RXG19966.1 trk system potassium uptake protein TrkA [Leeuwenhoekiella polynyae]|tara:strand:+ start:291 stop:974 length:684 start_codon:yes stop_codon:yes gene_type:complete
MKYIIIGLGSFGASLAEKLTAQGNEVIGIDIKMPRVDALKEKITHTICLDATDESTVSGLPLKDTDIVIVAIGENQGTNVMVTALFKNLQVKKLISRAVNTLHENVLNAIGVDEIVHPEQESAERWAKRLCMRGVVDSFELNDYFSIVEVKLPVRYANKTVEEVQFRERYNLLVLTTLKNAQVETNIGKKKTIIDVQSVATPKLLLEQGDILVLYGSNKDIRKFINS